jgi:large subunit ribosomal protein L6
MSRVGKAPITVPTGVKVDINGSLVSVTGKLGTLSYTFAHDVQIKLADGVLTLALSENPGASRAMWGLSRGLLNNMVTGVSEGFEKKLEIVGVGYKAAVSGKYLTLSLGHSHDIKFEIPQGITIQALKPTSLSITGCDKQKVGQVAAMIVQQRPPEPYKGKGVKYEGQWILRKEGKKK